MRSIFQRALHALILVSLMCALWLSTPGPASAGALITVTTTNDEAGSNTNACSLREAIIAANRNQAFGGCPAGGTGTDQIFLPASPSNYQLTIAGSDAGDALKGDLDITGSVAIYGDGWNKSIIESKVADRVFEVLVNSSASGPVTMTGVGITGGKGIQEGAGILVRGYFASNTYLGSDVRLALVKIYGNNPLISGGGLTIKTNSIVRIDRSEIAGNKATSAAAIANDGTLIMTNSLVDGNEVTTDASGAISSNSLKDTEYTQITNSTIANNKAPAGKPAGISISDTGKLQMLNVTIVDNLGVGLEIKSGAKGTMKNTILARQGVQATPEADCKGSSSNFVSLGNNLFIKNTTCTFKTSSDLSNNLRNELLIDSALADNGGPTLTYALLDGSPAQDAANDSGCPKYDQRLYTRPADAHCDIGAFELNGTHFLMNYLPVILR